MKCIHSILFYGIYIQGGKLVTLNKTHSSTFTVTFPDREEEYPSAEIELFNAPDVLGNNIDRVEGIEITAGFRDLSDKIFEGAIRSHGIYEQSKDRSYRLVIKAIQNGTDILKRALFEFPINTTIYNAVISVCSKVGLKLNIFEGNKSSVLSEHFSTFGSYYEVLSDLALLVNCTVSYVGKNIHFRLVDKQKNNHIIKVSTKTNSVLDFSTGYDDKLGPFVDFTTPLLANIRKGTNIFVEIDKRGGIIKHQGAIQEYTHSGGYGKFPTTKMKMYV